MFFKKHKQLLKECTESEKKCLEEFLDKLRYFTCTNCDTKLYSVEKPPTCPKCGRKMLIVPLPKEHKSSKDVPSAKTQRIAPPLPQTPPIRIVKDGIRIFNSEPSKNNNSSSVNKNDIDKYMSMLKDNMPEKYFEMFKNQQNNIKNENTGLTEKEQEISDLTAQIWNKFVSLEQTHTSDLENVQQAIHQLQYILAIRTVRRDYPNQWKSYKGGN